MIMRLCKMQEMEADIVKMAVMPRERERCADSVGCYLDYEGTACSDPSSNHGNGRARTGQPSDG